MTSAMIPTFKQKGRIWFCYTRSIWGAGLVTGTGVTRKAAYADWVSQL